MFTEELKKIKEAEEQADEMRRDARLSAKNLVAEANTRAGKMIEEAYASEKEQCDALLQKGREEAQRLYDEAIRQAEVLCAEMTAGAAAREAEAVHFIAERIVDRSVNR